MRIPGYNSYCGFPLPPGAVQSANGRFTYGEDGFALDNIQLESPDELKYIIEVGIDLNNKLRRTTKAWITAQLECYGVDFKKSAIRPVLVDALEKAVRGGKQCDHLSATVKPIHDFLCEQFESKVKTHAQAVERWKDEHFASLQGGPDSEAAVDMGRFVAKYFLDVHGLPDRTKTKDPLAVSHWRYPISAVAEATEKIPGLKYRKFPRDMVIIGWDTELERGVEREFANLSSSAPSTMSRNDLAIIEADFEVDLFLKKYFRIQTVNGVAAIPREKPSALVFLPSSVKMDSYLKTIASNFPGLCVELVKKSKREREISIGISDLSTYKYTVIGWDAKTVEAALSRIKETRRRVQEDEMAKKRAKRTAELVRQEDEAADKRAKRKAEDDKQWVPFSAPHRQFAARQRPRLGPLGLKHLVGSYIVRWEGETGSQWSYPYNPANVLRLNISPTESAHGVRATFFFGWIEGIMLLAMSKRSVRLLREEQPRKNRWGETMDADWNDDFDHHEDYYNCIYDEEEEPKEIIDPTGKGETTSSTRVYFQCVFSEVDGYPIQGDNNEHIGYLDFDTSKFSAKGYMNLGSLCGAEPFSIYKVSDKTLPPPRGEHDADLSDWCMYDGRHWGY
ncbi:hypothetical protein B0T25DRAFT_445595 [Lasiosphaeria hispida]|uniref:Uncharacterized protein n=1 Tax=Lasiosphaeria hispida TaxID=260671 RepID=A0AAJ0HTM4_9PEZI|nr:hypothetical protein B0T25DRAFT_445595 [Lasiosphaeria hispida]